MGFNDKHLSFFEGYRMLYETEMAQFVFMDREMCGSQDLKKQKSE
jgi:hypothetical protein